MEDPLKPKPVPIDTNTLLWFEFLLDPQLITKHLQKADPDPTPIDLLAQLISMTPDQVVTQFDNTITAMETDVATGAAVASPVVPGPPGVVGSTVTAAAAAAAPPLPPTGILPTAAAAAPTAPVVEEGLRITRKQLALKILALKTATWLKWNLDIFEKSMPIAKQMFLLRDLCTISFGKLVSIPLTPDFEAKITPEGNENAARFALALYHRWVLRLQLLKDIAMRAARSGTANMFVPMEPMHQFFAPEIPPDASLTYLSDLAMSEQPFYVFNYDTFVPLSAHVVDTSEQNFTGMTQISQTELRAQIYFDLANYYLYSKKYMLARSAVEQCRNNYIATTQEYTLRNLNLPTDYRYCHVKEGELEGYLLACGVSAQPDTLLARFMASQMKQYKDIVEILKEDNIAREIPLVNRRICELDIEAYTKLNLMPLPPTLVVQVAALNVVRSIFEEDCMFSSPEYFDKYKQMDCVSPFIEYICHILPHCTPEEKDEVREFLLDSTICHANSTVLLQKLVNMGLLSESDIDELKSETDVLKDIHLPPLATQTDWKFSSTVRRIEIGALERQLISCIHANSVRKLLVRLAATNPTKPLWTINPSWEVPTPIKSLLLALPRGFLQDFAYVLLGKSRELAAKKDYIAAVSMLSVLKSETQRQELSQAGPVGKLSRLVTWEILLIQITQSLNEWNRKPLDLQALGNRCKQCLSVLQNGDTIMPRIEIIENCAVMLLNLNDWNALMFLDKRLPQLELPIAIASTFLDMEKCMVNKKICREAWDILLMMFASSKRATDAGASGSRNSNNSHDAHATSLAMATGLEAFLKRVRSQVLFSLIISMLSKMHNILKDDAAFDVMIEDVQLWPTSITNPIAYNLRSVSETLNWVLEDSLKYYPQCINFLKIKGDLELSLGNNEAAMRCYVDALITGTENCTIPLLRTVADDFMIRKMIRCALNLGCYMQATVLTQFLEEIDYAVAFKNLTEKSVNSTDAMDLYYNCIWDTTLLEFIINLHSKKGEHTKKLEAMSIMGTLELNANNADDIKREAIAIRKSRFLQALARQYLL